MPPRLLRLTAAFLVAAATPAAAQPAPTPRSSLEWWQAGQAAMDADDADRAITCYRESLRLDPTLARNHLSLAAAFLEKGDDVRAAACLESYVRAQPRHVVVRAHLADLLHRLGRLADARDQYEAFIALAQPDERLADEHLVHCHTRLMEIAEAAGDAYDEHLNRGIGLLCLARRHRQAGLTEAGLTPEALLCQAAGELALARRERPDEARPCWYLFETWSELGQSRPATRWLRAAAAAAALGRLTPEERAGLRLACRDLLGPRVK
jgi:tetratricopeptide (TPR) repeat protein